MGKHKDRLGELLAFTCSLEMQQKIKAISYQCVATGGQAATIRRLVEYGIQVYEDGLAPREKTHLAQILENVKIGAAMNPKEKKKRKSWYVKKKLRGSIL